MKVFAVLSAFVLLGASALANAHAHLKEARPADGSVLAAAPTSLVLKFSEAVRVTALTLSKEGGPEQKLGPLAGGPAAEASAALPKLTPGKYRVDWRLVGDDGHVMSGKLQFTVDPGVKPVAGKAPDHQH